MDFFSTALRAGIANNFFLTNDEGDCLKKGECHHIDTNYCDVDVEALLYNQQLAIRQYFKNFLGFK